MSNAIKKDDIVLIIRPNFNETKWSGTVDLNVMYMPSDKLDEESYEELMGLMHGVITCFHLLNTDAEFGEKVSIEMDKMIESGKLTVSQLDENTLGEVIDLTEWTQTRGNA
jgi:hypothetical protein